MTDADDDEASEPLGRGWAAQAAGSVAGAGLGLVTGDPAVVLAAALVPQAVLAVTGRLGEAVHARRVNRAARTLQRAADDLGVDVVEVERLSLRDDATTELLGRVLEASADTMQAQGKVEALGLVLAGVLRDPKRFDEAHLLATALRDLEPPHVRTLVNAGEVWSGSGGRTWHRWGGPALPVGMQEEGLRRAAGGEAVGGGVLAVLTRHGLVERGQNYPDVVNKGPGTPTWLVTELGVLCLRLLVPEPPAWKG